MAEKKILVTGANGQLGREFRSIAHHFPKYTFLFVGHSELPIEDEKILNAYFNEHRPFACVNCAAYTAVDKAEIEKEKAQLVNADATAFLASSCNEFNTQFIHISTDYVFDGNSSTPYREDDLTQPVNHYGLTKLKGEQLAISNNPSSIIIRTSWVYSAFGNNFVKTMMRLMKERDSINVVNDQVGSPTYAADLAEAIMKMISMIDDRWSIAGDLGAAFDDMMTTEAFSTTAHSGSPIIGHWPSANEGGIFHYSNEGVISWYEFAVAIKELIGSNCEVKPIPTSGYPTPAKRPKFSLLDKSKIKSVFGIEIPGWKERLVECVRRIQESGVRSQNG